MDIFKYILKRVLAAIVTIWLIMTVTFLLMHAIPGDPFNAEKMPDPELRAAMYEKYGLDKPLWEQYVSYIGDFLHGDFGLSYKQRGLSTNDIIEAGFPYSLRIGCYAIIAVIVLGILFGLLAALRHNRFVDRLLMFLSTIGATIPTFVFATLFLYVFAGLLGWVPSARVDSWKGYIGPSIVLALFPIAYVTRLMRSSMLDVMNSDYIRTARAKGLPEWMVIGKHGLRNALLPVVTYVGTLFASLITGSLVVEKVFSVPGIGSLFTNSVLNRDYTLIMGTTVFFAVILVVSVLFVDILYMLIDPRIRLK